MVLKGCEVVVLWSGGNSNEENTRGLKTISEIPPPVQITYSVADSEFFKYCLTMYTTNLSSGRIINGKSMLLWVVVEIYLRM